MVSFPNNVRSRWTVTEQVAKVIPFGHLTLAPIPATSYAPTLPASLPMKFGLLIILTLLTIIPSVGQEINKITFSSQGSDEPPTKQGKPLLTVEYLKDDLGNYTATHYFENRDTDND